MNDANDHRNKRERKILEKFKNKYLTKSKEKRASVALNNPKTIEMLTEATLKGIGYVRLPDFFNSKYLNNGSLVPLLPNFKLLPERGIYAIYPDRRYLPLKVFGLTQESSTLIAKKICNFSATICASPDFMRHAYNSKNYRNFNPLQYYLQ